MQRQNNNRKVVRTMAKERAKGVALKMFFSTDEFPVSTAELMTFAKADKAGYDELATLANAELDKAAGPEVK